MFLHCQEARPDKIKKSTVSIPENIHKIKFHQLPLQLHNTNLIYGKYQTLIYNILVISLLETICNIDETKTKVIFIGFPQNLSNYSTSVIILLF